MKKKLYLVYKNGYIEDYILIYASAESEIVSEYCKEWDRELIALDEFYETHTVDEIGMIGDKVIKEIIFENKEKCVACGGSGHYRDGLCSSCNGTGYEEE